jgi:hypothetical protein
MLRKFVSNYFRKRLINYFLKQQRNAKIQTLSDSRSIGILWNPVDEGSIETYELVRKTLKDKGIAVTGLGYADRKTEQNLSLVAHSGFSNNSNVGLSGKPVSGPGEQFVNENFDILIDLSVKKVLALEYILVHSEAKFKVGWESTGTNYYDLNIDVSKQPTCRYLMEQIIFYLEKINGNQGSII